MAEEAPMNFDDVNQSMSSYDTPRQSVFVQLRGDSKPTSRTHVRRVAWNYIAGEPCYECYFYGFVDHMPESNHTCPCCRVAGIGPTVEVSFEQWQEYGGREIFASMTFHEMITAIEANWLRVRHRMSEYKDSSPVMADAVEQRVRQLQIAPLDSPSAAGDSTSGTSENAHDVSIDTKQKPVYRLAGGHASRRMSLSAPSMETISEDNSDTGSDFEDLKDLEDLE